MWVNATPVFNTISMYTKAGRELLKLLKSTNPDVIPANSTSFVGYMDEIADNEEYKDFFIAVINNRLFCFDDSITKIDFVSNVIEAKHSMISIKPLFTILNWKYDEKFSDTEEGYFGPIPMDVLADLQAFYKKYLIQLDKNIDTMLYHYQSELIQNAKYWDKNYMNGNVTVYDVLKVINEASKGELFIDCTCAANVKRFEQRIRVLHYIN